MELYGVKLSYENLEEQISRYGHDLVPDKQARLVRLRRGEDKLRMIAGDRLIYYLIKEKLPGANYQIAYSKYGKPYLTSDKDCHFNISHSGEWVIGAISNQAIGVDIEKIAHLEVSIIKKIGTPAEQAFVNSLDEVGQLEKLYDLWTIKESYSKLIGKGLGVPFEQVHINEQNHRVQAEGETGEVYFNRYEEIPGYKVAVSMSRNETVHFQELTLQMLETYWQKQNQA